MTDRNVTISPLVEHLSDLPEKLRFLNGYLDHGFKHLEVIKLRKRYLTNVIDTLVKSYGASVSHIKATNVYHTIVPFDGVDVLVFSYRQPYDSNGVCLVIATTEKPEVLAKFINTLPLTGAEDDNTSIDLSYYYMSKRDGLTQKEINVDIASIKDIYPELYPDIDITKLLKSYNDANEPVLMLYGDPGVGKTSFIKYIISSGEYKKIAYVKDPMVMEDGELWVSLTSENFELIIFDDLDIGLLPRRKNTEGTFMTQLLSYSDGIFTHGKTKIVVTTNQTVKEIDSALVRPGRCFDFIQLRALPTADARAFWIDNLKLNADLFDTLFEGNQIVSQATLMSEAARAKSANGSRNYIKRGSSQYTLEDKLGELGIQTSNGDGAKAGF